MNNKVFAKNYYSIMIKDDMLYASGNIGDGETMFGKKEYPEFTKIFDQEVKDVTCGTGNIFIITKNNEVYARGNNDYGQLGTGDKISTDDFIKIDIDDVVKIATGTMFTYFLLADGNVKSCGKNDYGQLGLGTDDTCITLPTHINVSNIKDIQCGHSHTLLLSNDGEVYVTGMNILGQLGMPFYEHIATTDNNSFINEFKLVDGIKDVDKIVCSSATSYLLIKGKMYSAGCNLTGQTGLGEDPMMNAFRFTEVPNLNDVIDIVAGNDSVFAILKDNILYACGKNISNCLGIGTEYDYINTFKRVDVTNVKSVTCGSEHSFITTNYRIIGVGDNTHHQLSLPNTDTNLFITVIDFAGTKLRKPVLTWLNENKEFVKTIKFTEDDEYVLEGEKSKTIVLYLVNNFRGEKDSFDIHNMKLSIHGNSDIENEKWLFTKCNYDFTQIGTGDKLKIESLNNRQVLSGAANTDINNENTAKIEMYMIPKDGTDVPNMTNNFRIAVEYEYGEI